MATTSIHPGGLRDMPMPSTRGLGADRPERALEVLQRRLGEVRARLGHTSGRIFDATSRLHGNSGDGEMFEGKIAAPPSTPGSLPALAEEIARLEELADVLDRTATRLEVV